MSITRARPRSRSRVRPPVQGSSLSADLAAVAMVVSMAAVAAAAGMANSAISPPRLPGTGPPAALRAVASGLGLGGLGRTGAAVLSLLVVTGVVAAFLFSLREAWHGRLSARKVLWFGIAFQVVMAALPLLLSRDVYSYAIYARIDVVHHANPYVATPLHFPGDPLYPYVGPVWRDAPAIYGPAFTLLSGALARLTSSPVALVWAFKAIGGIAGIGTLLIVAWVAKRVAPGRAAFAIALFGWNPAIVVYATGGGHNDLLVALCIAGALAFLVRGGLFDRPYRTPGPEDGRAWEWPWHELLAVALLTVGTLVKASAGPALALAVVASVAARPAGRRIRLLCAEAAVVAALVVAFAAPYWQTRNPTLGVSSLATHRGWVTATRLLLATLGGIAENLWGRGGRSVVEAVIRISVTGTAFVGLCLVAVAAARRIARGRAGPAAPTEASADGEPSAPAQRSSREASVLSAPWTAAAEGAAWAWALLLFIVASPVLLPWYMTWMLPLAWVLPRAGRFLAVAVSCLLCVTHAIAEPELVWHIYKVQLWIGHDVVGPIMLVTLVWLAVRAVRMARGRSAVEGGRLTTRPAERGDGVSAGAQAR